MAIREYKGIDLGRFIFACLIPILHLSLPGTYIVQQYISRIGVPFFFAVSGMFLSLKRKKQGSLEAWSHYSAKILRLLSLWLLIYSPLTLVPY